MIADLIRSDTFKTVFSLLLGLALVIVIFRPYCKGDECAIWKAPPTNEVNGAVFQIGKKCYRYKENDVECITSKNLVEAFRGEFACRPSRSKRETPLI